MKRFTGERFEYVSIFIHCGIGLFYFTYSIVRTQAIPILVPVAFFESLVPCWFAYFPQNLRCFLICSIIIHTVGVVFLSFQQFSLHDWHYVSDSLTPFFIASLALLVVYDSGLLFWIFCNQQNPYTIDDSEDGVPYTTLNYDSDRTDPWRSDSEVRRSTT